MLLKIGLTGFDLKLIAVVTMLIDHVGVVLYPGEVIFRYIGRLSFPLFCFLLVEGFFYTKNLRKYLLRLIFFAVISEIPFDLAFHQTFWYPEKQNVFFTLFIGLLLLICLKSERDYVFQVGLIIVAVWIAELLHTDYHGYGVLLIVIFYYLRDKKKAWLLLSGGWNFLWKSKIQYAGALTVLPILLYNGKRGRQMKYFFYLFYPIHLIVLYILVIL